MMSLLRRRMMMAAQEVEEMNYIMDEFSVDTSVRNFTYYHTLGRKPKFCIIYPIDIQRSTDLHTIGVEIILNQLGQEDYALGTDMTMTIYNNPYVMWCGTGYSNNVNGFCLGNSTHENINVYIDDSAVVLGAMNGTFASGHLAAGTYGIIIG